MHVSVCVCHVLHLLIPLSDEFFRLKYDCYDGSDLCGFGALNLMFSLFLILGIEPVSYVNNDNEITDLKAKMLYGIYSTTESNIVRCIYCEICKHVGFCFCWRLRDSS